MDVRKLDPFSLDVYNFRKEVIITDENSKEIYLQEDVPYDKNISEEVWKFSKRKWNSLNFDLLYGVYFENELASISGSKLYGNKKNILRTGMMYYTLKRFRTELRSPLWTEQGLLHKSIDFFDNIDYVFISIYPHNNKLKSWINVFGRGNRLGQLHSNNHLSVLKSFSKYPVDVKISGVFQTIFYLKKNSNKISIEEMIDEIADK
jgi:hypothetical protein